MFEKDVVLSDSLKEDLLKWHSKLDRDGKLLSKQRLAECYATFRERFGPEHLAALDGEALLVATHHSSDKDSLVYWLEWKNDDELPAMFGSIAGGNALKFGIYRQKATGAWMTGSPHKQYELQLHQAIDIARKYRDQLIKGTVILREFESGNGDADYAQLQELLLSNCPDVADSAWGHKYFSLLFPQKLDNYHTCKYQRHHLIKALQLPPNVEGRYASAGRFIRMARELGIPASHLTQVMNARDGRAHKYWRVGTSDGTKQRNRWDMMRDGSFIAIGWPELGDLSALAGEPASTQKLDQLRDMLEEKYPNTPQQIGVQAREVLYFACLASPPDMVLACDGETVIGVGRIAGGYEYDPSTDFPHHIPVKWRSLKEWKMPKTEGLRSSFRLLRRFPENLVEAERMVFEAVAPPPPDRRALSPLTGIPKRIQEILERRGQVILYGPPGTGKTHWAVIAARELASRDAYRKNFDDLTVAERDRVLGTGDLGGLVRTCCFHPAYGYEDFLEGYRPNVRGNQLVFALKSGIFKSLCEDAAKSPNERFYLVVDEINRGDIPRIFGELLTILEMSKRSDPITLPLSGKDFRVPKNVFVIGTMNTADRSIALLDTALRRRFGFVELMPDYQIFGEVAVRGIPLGQWLMTLNKRVCEHVGRDARNLQIGHSYLMDSGKPIAEFGRFKKALSDTVFPLLQEYCYEDYETLSKILGNRLVDASMQEFAWDLFEEGNEDELVLALQSIDPEIVTSPEAVAAAQASEEEEAQLEAEESEEDENAEE